MIRLGAAASAAFLAAAPAVAQSGGPPAGLSPWRVTVDGGAVSQSGADLKDGGSFSIARGFSQVGVSYGFGPRTSIGLSIGGGASDYDFDASTMPGGAPWGRIEDYRIAAPIRFGISDTGSAIVIPSVRYSGEAGVDPGDAQTAGVLAGAFWRVRPNLNIGPGFGAFSSLDDDGVRAFPILIIDWDITDRWSLSTGQGLAASQGPGLTLTYQASETLTLGVAGRSEDLEFRLDDDGPAPGGIGRDRAYPLVGTLAWRPNPAVRVSGFAGVELGGQLTLEDKDGTRLDRQSYDPAPIFGATVDFRF